MRAVKVSRGLRADPTSWPPNESIVCVCEFSREPIEIANNFLILHKVLVAFHLCFYFFRLGLVVLFRETNPKNMNSVLIIFWFRSSLCLRLRAQCSFFSGYANTENTRRQCTDNTQSTAIIRSVENARARAHRITQLKRKKRKRRKECMRANVTLTILNWIRRDLHAIFCCCVSFIRASNFYLSIIYFHADKNALVKFSPAQRNLADSFNSVRSKANSKREELIEFRLTDRWSTNREWKRLKYGWRRFLNISMWRVPFTSNAFINFWINEWRLKL